MFRPVSFLAIAFLLGTPAYAQDKTSEIDKILRFHRDKAGKVVALDYSNPVVRNITFTRQSGN
ncbi:MAG TPA: hypothetical protein VEL51_06015 [Vicinamibacterales bacterium]|nr:hypothetical protein [Vicinamibacterales bacterium]